jgi:uncharacterized protein
MLIGVISDTHDNLAGLKKAIRIFKDENVEMIIHCGDWCSPFTVDFFDKELQPLKIPVKSVIGNNPGDIKRILLTNNQKTNPIEWARRTTIDFAIDNQKAIIYHGEDPELLNALIDCHKYNVIFTGHTHAVRNEVINDILVLNPGSTSYSAEGGSISESSVAIYDSAANSAKIINFC